VATAEEQALASEARALIATYREAEDLINIGAYVKGSNPKIDRSIEKMDSLNEFFKQAIFEQVKHEEAVVRLAEILKG
jgi:flagellum-specific ATP synthase